MADELTGNRKARATFIYEIPPQDAGDPNPIDTNEWKSVGLVELTAEEELAASRKGGKDSFKIAYELAKASLVEINGKKLDRMNGDDEAVWVKMPPTLRSLVLDAYAEIHAPQEATRKGFLASKKVKVA